MSGFNLDDYKDVPSRLAEFKAKHPDGSLQPADLSKPFEVVIVGERTFIAYIAAAYRGPDDPRPGIGVAWETFPGKTTYTRDSELQNAETSAWGRAVVAALAADTRMGIASREDVRNRNGEAADDAPPDEGHPGEVVDLRPFAKSHGVRQSAAARALLAIGVHDIAKVPVEMRAQAERELTAAGG